MFFTIEDLIALSREIRRLPKPEIDEELRGWSYSEGVVSSQTKLLMGVSDITNNFCPNGRDIYLRYVKKVPPEDNQILQKGRLVHELWTKSLELVKKTLYAIGGDSDGERLYREIMDGEEKIKENAYRKYNLLDRSYIAWLAHKFLESAARTYSSAFDKHKARSPYITLDGLVYLTSPLITEFPINGELVGLSKTLRVDALAPPSILIEVKTRSPREIFEASLAGYALAFESEYEVPVDFGVLLYINVMDKEKKIFSRAKLVPISAQLRTNFIELRDRRAEIIAYEEDPGIPNSCPPECPYLKYCSRDD